MWELTSIVVGFLVVSAGVIALARSTTARWEREKRASRVPRRAPVAPRADAAARLGRAWAEAAAAARLRAIGHTLAGFRQHVVRGVRDVPDALRHVGVGHRAGGAVVPRPRRGEDPLVDGEVVDGEVVGATASAPEPARRAHLARRRLTAGLTSHDPRSAIPRLTSQLAARVGHRQGTRRPPRAPDDHSGPAS
jgi:hypothetical protein